MYELAHESLLSAWGTLRGWLDDAAGQRGIRTRLGAAADEWHRLGRRRELLWKRSQLTETAQLTELTQGDRAFLDASRAAARRRVALAVALTAAIPAAAALTWWSASYRERERRELLVDQRRADADAAMQRAHAALTEAHGLRAEATARFRGAAAPKLRSDVPEVAQALSRHYREQQEARNRQWSQSERRFEDARNAMREAARILESARELGARRSELASSLADVMMEQLTLADFFGDAAAIEDLEPRLATYDDGRRLARWRQRTALLVRASGATSIELQRYQPGEGGRLAEEHVAQEGGEALRAEVPPGSYRARVTAPGIEPVLLPFVVRRERPVTLEIQLPQPGQVPPGFVYVPAGAFLRGSEDHQHPDLAWIRRSFFDAPPRHEEVTGPYLIGRYEVTFADWLRYLRTLDPARLAARRQSGDITQARSVRLDGDGRGPFTLTLRPLGEAFSAVEGQPLVFPRRQLRQRVRWELTPAAGINREDAEAFAAWLDRTGQVPGARLCTPLEWERAARGADGRRFPHGNDLRPSDANIDETYSREALSPDEVGAHPASVSPFGVHDLAGNAFELVTNGPHEIEMRGGSWWNGSLTATAMNVTAIQPSRRDPYIGVRLCASVSPRPKARRRAP